MNDVIRAKRHLFRTLTHPRWRTRRRLKKALTDTFKKAPFVITAILA